LNRGGCDTSIGRGGRSRSRPALVEARRCGIHQRDCPPRIRQLLEAQGYFALTTEERIAKHEEAMRVLASIDRGAEDDGCLCGQCSRWLDCLLRQKSEEA